MNKCARCGHEEMYQTYGELLCRDCLVDEYGICAVCAHVETCDDIPKDMVLTLCTSFDEIKTKGKDNG